MYHEEIKHECPVDIKEIIGGHHNAIQHSLTKLSMGQVTSRIWTEIQKGEPKQMLLVALRKAGRRGKKTTMVHHSDLRKSLQLSPNVYVCPFSVYPMQDTMLKNWRPLVTLLQLSDERVAEYLGIFEKNSGEGTTAFLVPFFVYFACGGRYSARIPCEPIYCPAVINPYTLRPMTGLHGDWMDDVLLYMASEDAKMAELHSKARLLKREHS